MLVYTHQVYILLRIQIFNYGENKTKQSAISKVETWANERTQEGGQMSDRLERGKQEQGDWQESKGDRVHTSKKSDYDRLWAGRGGELSERMNDKDHEWKEREEREISGDRHTVSVIGSGAIVMRW